MSEDLSARHVRKFDGTNFQGWKFQINTLFIANGIQDIVKGTRVKPEDANSAEAKAWARDNAKAMFIISSAMEYTRLEPLLVCTSAKDMWDRLCSIHEQKSASNRLLLTQKFHEYRMSSSDSVVQHIAKIQNMAAQLTDLGETMSDVTVMAKILGSLSPKFSIFQTAWESVDPDRQNLENLQERLIREESRLNVDSEETSALVVTKTSKNKKRVDHRRKTDGKLQKSDKKKVECYKCHELGHFAYECPSKKSQKTEQNKSQNQDCAFIVEKLKGSRCRSFVKSESSEWFTPSSKQIEELLEVDQCQVWLTDSGASCHLSYRREWFTDYTPNRNEDYVALGDDKLCKVAGEGTVLIEKLVNEKWCEARIENVLHVPELKKNLFSVGVCTRKGYEVRFKGKFVIFVHEKQTIASGVKQDNEICRLFFRALECQSVKQANATTVDLQVWHERLGHVNKRAVQELIKKGLVNGASLSSEKDFFCEMCHLGKAHRLPFKKMSAKVPTKPGEHIHTDVCGPMSVESLGGKKYFLTFKDDATNYRHVFFLKYKSEVVDKFKIYEKLVSNKYGRSIKVLRSDNGLEFCNSQMN